jgi:hypothetical protein
MKSFAVDTKAPSLKKPWIWSEGESKPLPSGRSIIGAGAGAGAANAAICGSAADLDGMVAGDAGSSSDGPGGSAGLGWACTVAAIALTTALTRILIVPLFSDTAPPNVASYLPHVGRYAPRVRQLVFGMRRFRTNTWRESPNLSGLTRRAE